MQILPEGFALPPAPYLLALLAGLVAVGAGFARRRPPVTERSVLALTPWMAAGSALHVLYIVDALPPTVRPFAGTPSVYATVAVLAGATWLLADAADGSTTDGGETDASADGRLPTALVTAGTALLLPVVGVAVAVGLDRGSLDAVVPAAGLLAAVVVAAGTWVALRRLVPGVRVTGAVGALAVFGHALDGVSTALGVDLLGFGERTPLARFVIEFAAALPTADVLGAGWLFVLVKLVMAGVVVALMADYVREEPREGYALLGLVAAVGLGPGAHNLLLFAVS